jgi:hypothetical protein
MGGVDLAAFKTSSGDRDERRPTRGTAEKVRVMRWSHDLERAKGGAETDNFVAGFDFRVVISYYDNRTYVGKRTNSGAEVLKVTPDPNCIAWL